MVKRAPTQLTLLRRTVEEMVSVIGKEIANRSNNKRDAQLIAVFGGKLLLCYELKSEIDALQCGGMTEMSGEVRNRLRQLINSTNFLRQSPSYILFSEDREKLLAFL